MSHNESLDSVFRAVSNAVIEAQKLTEEQHQRQLNRYFDKKGAPLMVSIQVPDMSQNATSAYKTLDVPKLALLPPTALQIKDLKIKFSAAIVGFMDEEKEREAFAAVPGDEVTHSGPLYVDVTEGEESGPRKHHSHAEIEMNFSSGEPSPAFEKIIKQLNATLP